MCCSPHHVRRVSQPSSRVPCVMALVVCVVCCGPCHAHHVSQPSLHMPLVVQTCPGQSCHAKWSQTEFEPNQTNTNSFNWFWFWFQKFWLKPNSSVSGLGKNGLNQTKPNFPNTI